MVYGRVAERTVGERSTVNGEQIIAVNGQHPKISVVVPTYNRARMLRDCIDSILWQEFSDFELIIVSDGSTDDSETVVRNYGDPRILFLRKENGGQASARNLGIESSRGEYISFCDDDDRFHPDHLKVLSGFLHVHTEFGLAYTDALWVYNDGSRRKPEAKLSQDFNRQTLENFNYINPQTVLLKRILLEEAGFFDETPGIRGLEDWEFFLRLSDVSEFAHIRKATVTYTVHAGSSSQANSGYDYNRAFYLVRKKRFQHLLSRWGHALFDHVDHMYPFHLVQCFINNGEFEEAMNTALLLHDLHKEYAGENESGIFAGLSILFSLGISSFTLGNKNEAGGFLRSIAGDHAYHAIRPRFDRFVHEYAERMPDSDLRALLSGIFPSEPAPRPTGMS
ncbi:MAG: glycosyltransferase family A protein [Pseudomonadota bacterium]